MLYEGEISLHFDPPSRYSHRTRSPLLWAVIRILCLDTATFIDLLYVRLLCTVKAWVHLNWSEGHISGYEGYLEQAMNF